MQNYTGSRTHQTFWRRTFAMGLLAFTALFADGFILGGNSLASLEDRGTNPAASVTENHRPEDLSAIETTINTETLSNAELKASLDQAERSSTQETRGPANR